MFKRILLTLAVALAVSLISTDARAGETVTSKRLNCKSDYVTCPTSGGGTSMTRAAPLNGAPSTLTVVVDLGFGNTTELAQYSQLKMTVQYTKGAGDALTAVYYCSIDGTNYGQVTSLAVSAGAGTRSLFTDTIASASASPLVVVDIATCIKFKVIFASTGAPDGTDLLTFQAAVTAGS